MTSVEKRPLKVFLCHAHSDKEAVFALYDRLTKDGVDVWLDNKSLLPGQEWEYEIRKAVRESDVVVVCLSKQFNQAGFRQKEVRLALDTAMEQPEGEIFIIPARLEECDTLESLRKWHWVDLFEPDGYDYLLRALHKRADKIGVVFQNKIGWLPRIQSRQKDKTVAGKKSQAVQKAAVSQAPKLTVPPNSNEPTSPKKWRNEYTNSSIHNNSIILIPTERWPNQGIVYLLPEQITREAAYAWLIAEGGQLRLKEFQQNNFLIEETVLNKGKGLRPPVAYILKKYDSYRLYGGLPYHQKTAELFVNGKRVESTGIQLREFDSITWSGSSIQLTIAFGVKKSPEELPTQIFSPEANPVNIPLHSTLELQKLASMSQTIALLRVPKYFSGQKDSKSISGTAWVIAPELVITCDHVLRARNRYESLDNPDFSDQIDNSLLTFRFVAPGMGEEYGISRLEHRNEELDYAILRLKERPSLSASQWGYLRLARNDEPMTTQTSLIIFQHPLGKNNEYAIGNFVQKEAQTNIFYHDAVTHQGSSGAPIINKGTLNVIGIHQGENQDQKLRQGRLISSILDDLKIHKPDLYEKIIDSQNNWRS